MKMRYRVAACAAVVAAAAVWLRTLPAPGPATPGVPAALRSVAVPVRTADPGASLEDLEPLLPILASRRVVAVGEATHGTREFFQLKHRLVELLVSRAGFGTFAIESDPRTAAVVNAYVLHGSGDARQALLQLEFWTWQTEEVLALVEWLRAWNVAHPEHPVSFVGINATGAGRDSLMAENVQRELARAGPGSRMVLWAHNGHVSTAPGRMGSYLRRRLGARLYVVGFEFLDGSFRSRNLFHLRIHRVGAPGPGYYADALARLPWPIVFLDFHTAGRNAGVAAWLREPRRAHLINEVFYVLQISERFYSQRRPWPSLYDGVLFVRHAHAARGLAMR